jgi:hypothetical protein
MPVSKHWLQPDVDRHGIDLIAVRFTSTKPLPTSTKAATFILAHDKVYSIQP